MALTGLLCIAFTVFAANKYQLTKDNEQKLENLEKQLADLQDANMKLRYEIYGDPQKEVKGWTDLGLDAQLDYLRNLEAGESFVNCQTIQVVVDDDAKTSTVAFGVDPQYTMSSFRNGAVVYLFDSGEQYVAKEAADADSDSDASATADDSDEAVASAGSEYVFLGAFKVKGATSTQVNVDSIGFASDDELALLQSVKKSGNSLVAFVDRLPMDSPNDIAAFYAENSELFAAFDADLNAILSLGTADAEQLKDVETAADFENLFGADMRMPVAYQATLERQWSTRDAGNVMFARNTLALNDLNVVIANQLVAMGAKASKGFEDTLADAQAAVADFENWADFADAAKDRNKIPSYFEQLDDARAQLAKMQGYNELVKNLIAEAEENNKLCQEGIDAFIAENARLASEIARVQFAASEKLEKESSSRTAFDNVNTYVGI